MVTRILNGISFSKLYVAYYNSKLIQNVHFKYILQRCDWSQNSLHSIPETRKSLLVYFSGYKSLPRCFDDYVFTFHFLGTQQ